MSLLPLLQQANINLQSGDHDDAILTADLILSLDENNIDAMAIKIAALRNKGAYDDSIMLAIAMQAKAPEDIRGYLYHADSLMLQKHYKDARKIIMQGLAKHPRNPSLKYHLMEITRAEDLPQSPLRHKNISIIAPSRLQRSQYHEGNPYWLQIAYQNIMQQTVLKDMTWEIVIGVDAGTEIPAVLQALPGVRFAFAAPDAPRNQAAAMNAAVKGAQYEVLGFFEEDDLLAPQFFELALSYLDPFDFISANQQEVFPDGTLNEIQDFGTPNGWVMTRTCWNKVGGMDERFIHLDLDFLGRLNKAGCRRVFFYHTDFVSTLQRDPSLGAEFEQSSISTELKEWAVYRPNIMIIAALAPPGSLLVGVKGMPLITRLRHDSSVTGGIRTNTAQSARSAEDYKLLHELYGEMLPF